MTSQNMQSTWGTLTLAWIEEQIEDCKRSIALLELPETHQALHMNSACSLDIDSYRKLLARLEKMASVQRGALS